MVVLVGFAVLTLVLAVIGTYGVLAYLVSQRRREIGIRMALGADRRAVVRLLGAEGARLGALGIAAGVALALVAVRALEGMLFGVGAMDPMAFACTIAVVGVTSMLASGIPAARAARVDPGAVMREE